ncbi:O-antigen ligase family protein, partial [Patescibacteria group bacterium]|nr:O-antigen ligase family protein [Patescibacteria group bacterium]
LFCLVLGLWKREYALYLVFLELCLGSFGYLLTLSAGGLNLPIRMLFFLIIMALWAYDLISSKFKKLPRSNMVFSLGIFFIVWLFGILQGYLRGHNPANIFFDANSYLYLLLLLPALTYIDTKEKTKELIKVVLAGGAVLASFTFVLFLIFIKSQNLGFLEILYKWVRDFRIGELTSLKNGAYRIFIQSQIYLLAGFLLLAIKYLYGKIKFGRFVVLTALFSGAIYISLSRSLWVGLIAGILVLFGLLIYTKYKTPPLLRGGMRGLGRKILTVILAGVLGVLIVASFIPKDASMLGNRFKIGESALSTRVEQLKPLIPAIKANLIFGYGFGKTLTFKSFDPRVTTILKTGEYTTYAFEWGYLDIVLKIGVLGLLIYLYFIWTIVWALFKKLKTDWRCMWALSILAALLATHIFTPYLNHPLGIGILILGGIVANPKRVDNK